VLKPGYRWYGKAQVWQEETLETYVSLVWDAGCEEAWLLISDQGAGRRQVQEYAWRMRVEATFQDSKSRGFNILRQLDCRPGTRGIACCWPCFWLCGGPRIWQQRAFMMGNASADDSRGSAG
jgi:hypothetical protein